MKRKPQPARKRPVVAVTLSEGALAKLKRLTRRWGKTYDSHTVEKLIDDADEHSGGKSQGSGAPAHPAHGPWPAQTDQMNEPAPNYVTKRK